MKHRHTNTEAKYSMVPSKQLPLIRNSERNPQNWPTFNTKKYFYLEQPTFNVEQML